MILHKDIDKVLISQEEIENIVNSLAKQIEKDYNDKEFIMVGLLKGSIPFMADLMRHIHLDFFVDCITAASYGSGTETSGTVRIVHDMTVSVKDKHVLIVEDIVDSGHTLSAIVNMLMERGAKSVKICTLCDKPARRKVPLVPDYSGIEVPDAFIVGYGLDFAQKYRNLPYIGILKPEVYETT